MKQYLRGTVIFALALLPFLILFGTGVWGIDFGFHWDEEKIVDLVKQTINSGLFLPRWYKYPSVSYWLGLGTLLPYLRGAVAQVGLDVHSLRTYLQQVVQTPLFLLQMRQIFLLTSSLAVIWVFGAVWVLRRKVWEAFCAACLLGLSWEVAYHARWIAPDAVMMQFAALSLFCVALAWKGSPKWGIAAAFLGGVACSTKYPAGLLVVFLLLANYPSQTVEPWIGKLKRVIFYTLLPFAGGYLILTPGTLLDPLLFIKDIAYEMRHYQGAYDVQYVGVGFEHLGLIGIYLAFVLFSHYPGIAALFFLCALVGVRLWAAESSTKSAVLLVFPVLYIAYFCMQQVMAVRNYLVLTPFLALFAARGIGFIGDAIDHSFWRRIWLAIVLLLFAINAYWLFSSARSVVSRDADEIKESLKRVLLSQQDRSYFLSERVWNDIGADELELDAELLTGIDKICQAQERWVVMYAFEAYGQNSTLPLLSYWKKGAFEDLVYPQQIALYGPWEVNFHYYPLWAGNDRVLMIKSSRVCSLMKP